jgi:hypothetical protein
MLMLLHRGGGDLAAKQPLRDHAIWRLQPASYLMIIDRTIQLSAARWLGTIVFVVGAGKCGT